MADATRIKRIAERIQRDLALFIHREIRDPRVGFVTITDVKVSRDLSYADIYVAVLGKNSEEEARDSIRGLQSAAGFLRNALRKDLNTKVTPRLRFHFDEVFIRGQNMNILLSKINTGFVVGAEENANSEQLGGICSEVGLPQGDQ